MENQIMSGFKNMLTDFGELMMLGLTTQKGLAVVTLCIFIYFITIYVMGCQKRWILLAGLLALICFMILAWFTWFKVVPILIEKN